MLKRLTLMKSISSNLFDFLKKISKNLPVPSKKFLKDAMIGFLRCGKPIVCQIAKHVPNQQAKFLSRLDRLNSNMVKNSDFDDRVKCELPQFWLPFVQEYTPIILDLSDIAKPLAKKMDYLAMVYDGSANSLVTGYWLMEIYLSLSRKNPVPVLLEPFSHKEPESRGQNPVVLEAVHKIMKLTNNRGVLIADRGFDSGIMLRDWLDNKYKFVVRLAGRRHLLQFYKDSGQSDLGQWITIPDRVLAEQMRTPHSFSKSVKSHGKIKFRFSRIGWIKVRLPGWEEDLTMIVSRIQGCDQPMMLLTNLRVENVKEAQHVMRLYMRRWECEEGIRFLKNQVHLEKIRTFRWPAVRRLVLLAVLIMIYLGHLIEADLCLCDRLIYLSQPLPDKPDLLYYRLLTGLTEALNYCFYVHKDFLRQGLW